MSAPHDLPPGPINVLMPYPDALPTIHGITVGMHRNAQALRRFGVHAVIAARRPFRHGPPSGTLDGVTYHRWRPPLAALLREAARVRSPWFPDRYLNLEAAAVARLVRVFRPDVLHVREPYGVLTALAMRDRFGTPFVVSLHTFSPLYHERLEHGRPVHSEQGLRWTEWFLAIQERVPIVIAASRDVADRYIAMGLAPARVRVIPHGIPDAFFAAARGTMLHDRFGFDRADDIVLVVSRLEPIKGQRDVVAAVAALRGRHARLRLVLLGGREPYEQREADDLRHLAVECGIGDDVAIDSLDPYEMPAALASATVVVQPTRLYEGFGLPAAEAAAAARPVIATRVGALPEIVEDRSTGILVPPADPPAIADAISELLTDPSFRERLAVAARERALERFSIGTSAARYAAAYHDALRSSGGGRGD